MDVEAGCDVHYITRHYSLAHTFPLINMSMCAAAGKASKIKGSLQAAERDKSRGHFCVITHGARSSSAEATCECHYLVLVSLPPSSSPSFSLQPRYMLESRESACNDVAPTNTNPQDPAKSPVAQRFLTCSIFMDQALFFPRYILQFYLSWQSFSFG